MVRNRYPGDVFGADESAEAAYGTDPIDEYRELALLARAWERGTLASELLLPMSFAVLPRIEHRRVESGIHPDIGIVFAEDILTGDIQLHASRERL